MTDRSFLFVPGDRPERFDKTVHSGAHQVIIDLEDAVTPQRKDAAREAVGMWLRDTAARVCLRINPADTPWHEADRALLAWPAVSRVMLPKAQARSDLESLARLLSGQTAHPPAGRIRSWMVQPGRAGGCPARRAAGLWLF